MKKIITLSILCASFTVYAADQEHVDLNTQKNLQDSVANITNKLNDVYNKLEEMYSGLKPFINVLKNNMSNQHSLTIVPPADLTTSIHNTLEKMSTEGQQSTPDMHNQEATTLPHQEESSSINNEAPSPLIDNNPTTPDNMPTEAQEAQPVAPDNTQQTMIPDENQQPTAEENAQTIVPDENEQPATEEQIATTQPAVEQNEQQTVIV